MKHDRIQQSLLVEALLNFETAFKNVRAMETAEKNLKDTQQADHTNGAEPEETAYVVEKQSKLKSKCFRCNGNHPFATCRFKNIVCRKCRKQAIYIKSLQDTMVNI